MNEIRYTNEAYPLYLNVNQKAFLDRFHSIVKQSKDFMGIADKECFDADIFQNKGINFAILYATEEGRDEMGEKLDNWGFGDRMFIAPNYVMKLTHTMPVYADYKDDPRFIQWLENTKSLHNDIVDITNDDYKKIVDSVYPQLQAKRLLLSELFNKDKVPLPVMSVKNADEIMNYTYQKETNTLFVECISCGRKMFKVKHEIHDIDDDEVVVECDTDIIFKSDLVNNSVFINKNDEDNTYLQDTMWRFFYINFFIRELPSCYKKRIEKTTDLLVNGKGINKKYKHKVILKTHYDINLKKMTTKHIKHIFSCLCWGVRGHYRHLKNGKVIFISSYRKGKERNNLQAFKEKEYKL